MAHYCERAIAPTYNKTDVLCHCLAIKRGEVTPILKGSAQKIKLEDLIGRSGVGSVCTGCHPLLEEMLGKSIWTSVTIAQISQVSDFAKSFRFVSNDEPLLPAKAGQHIILQIAIDGIWEMRRYTLTTPAAETRFHEITVQREPTGKVSNWLNSITTVGNQIRISQPLGQVTPDLQDSRPLICLVGGIGVTPAIAFIRTLDELSTNNRPLVLIHCVLNTTRLIYHKELKQLANRNNNISVNFQLASTDGLINQSDINQLTGDYPGSEYYVCGPPSFSNAVVDYLDKAGISNKSVSIEHFFAPKAGNTNQSALYFFVGSGLFIAFLLQDALSLKMPWLQHLQTQELYKIYSGLLLLTYIFSQFILPYNKACETPHSSATTYQHHKLRGAIAPLIFYIHSTQFGTAYILVLSIVFFSNFILGLCNHERVTNPLIRMRYFKFWLPAHITLSLLTLTMIAFHIFVVASY